MIRIANGQGFWGDWQEAPVRLVEQGPIDYLTLDYLAASRLALKETVAADPIAAPLVFMGLYALVVALSVPAASILTIFAGFLFGWFAGGFLVAIAATAGATVLFLAARTAFGDFLRERAGDRVLRLAEGFEKDAFGYLLALRLAPVFPFFLVNIAPAFFHVRLRTYLAATFLGILPATFVYAYLGRSIDAVLTEAHQAEAILEAGQADMIILARELLRDPNFPLRAAHELDYNITWPVQYERAKWHK